jgi:hypothetical protein
MRFRNKIIFTELQLHLCVTHQMMRFINAEVRRTYCLTSQANTLNKGNTNSIINIVISTTNNVLPKQGTFWEFWGTDYVLPTENVMWGSSRHSSYMIALSTIDRHKYGIGLEPTSLQMILGMLLKTTDLLLKELICFLVLSICRGHSLGIYELVPWVSGFPLKLTRD